MESNLQRLYYQTTRGILFKQTCKQHMKPLLNKQLSLHQHPKGMQAIYIFIIHIIYIIIINANIRQLQ